MTLQIKISISTPYHWLIGITDYLKQISIQFQAAYQLQASHVISTALHGCKWNWSNGYQPLGPTLSASESSEIRCHQNTTSGDNSTYWQKQTSRQAAQRYIISIISALTITPHWQAVVNFSTGRYGAGSVCHHDTNEHASSFTIKTN
jgi:hypothetical protein